MKKLLGLLLAPMLVFALAACDDDGGSGDSASPTKVGAKAKGTLTEDNFFETVTAAQVAAKSVTTELKVEAPDGQGEGLTMSGVMRMDPDVKKSAFDMKLGTAELPMHMIMVDGLMYIGMGAMTQDKFLKIDPNDPDDPLAEQFGSVTENSDPTAQLEQLEDAVTSVKDVGDGGEIDGVSTTKFEITVDPSKLPDAKAAAGMPETLEYVMWIGEDNLMRRMEMDVEGATFSVSWTKWGEPVKIKAPAKGDITEDAAGFGASAS